ncbi:MAG: uroporphyrinogen decarboxylase family protein [Treponemataceae bacterium]
MTKRERLLCAVKGGKPDRVPVSIYQHSTVHDRGVDEFVSYTLSFHKEFDPDYVKVMYDELYDAPVNYQFAVDSSVWDILEDLDPHKAAFGRYLESLKRIRAAVSVDTPVIATVFSPFHIAVRLAWTRLIQDCRTDRERAVRGLATISRNLIAFIKAAREEAEVDGFFLGCFGCEAAWLTDSEYADVASPFDRQVVAEMRRSPIAFVHSHGERGSYFDIISSYDCDAVSWEDRQAGPDLVSARKKTSKCLVGGVDHVAAVTAPAKVIREQALDAIRQTGGRGFILAPGCTFLGGTPKENMLALKEAAAKGAGV